MENGAPATRTSGDTKASGHRPTASITHGFGLHTASDYTKTQNPPWLAMTVAGAWQPSTDALRKGVAHLRLRLRGLRKHPVQHRRSTCQARGHAAQVQVSAARNRGPRCPSQGTVSVPPCHSTSVGTAQQPDRLFRPDFFSRTTRDQGSVASAVSATIASMCGSDASCK